jgi:capsular exopolysaccharide synthesis family protein
LLNGGLGPKHPTILALRGTKEEYLKQITDQISALRVSLSNQLRIAEESLGALEKELASAKEDQQGTRSQAVEYVEAKQAYIQGLALLEAAEQRLSTERMQLTMPQSPAILWEPAEPSTSPVRPKVLLNMILGVVVGLVLGVGAAFFLEYLDTSVKTMEEVEQTLGLPVLAVIPRNMSILARGRGIDADAEAYRILRTNIEFNRKNPDANTFTMVSGGAGEGKSTTLANVAYTFAEAGYKVLVIDADFRRPSQHKVFGLSNNLGLAELITQGISLDKVLQDTQNPNLKIVTSGVPPSDAVALLSNQRLEALLVEAKREFDVVFLDSPPILGVSDASILVSVSDLTIIVVQHRRFPRSMLVRVKNAVLNVGGNLLGVVLNNVDIRHDQNYEYYTNYYKYYAKADKRKKKPLPAGTDEYGAGASRPSEADLDEPAAAEEPRVARRNPAKKSFDY